MPLAERDFSYHGPRLSLRQIHTRVFFHISIYHFKSSLPNLLSTLYATQSNKSMVFLKKYRGIHSFKCGYFHFGKSEVKSRCAHMNYTAQHITSTSHLSYTNFVDNLSSFSPSLRASKRAIFILKVKDNFICATC